MPLLCRSIFLAVLVTFAVDATAQEVPEKPENERPAARANQAPSGFGFPRPEQLLQGFQFREERPQGRSSARMSRPLSLLTGEAESSGRLISVEVTLAETPAGDNRREMSVEKIAELEKAGKLLSQSRYWVSLVENQRSELQFGERVMVSTGRTNLGGGRGQQESFAFENVGTKLGLVGKLEGDSVVLQLSLDQTRLVPAAKPEGEASESAVHPRTATTSLQTTVTITPGSTVVAGGRETQGEKGTVQTWLLVSARVEGEKPKAAEKPAAAEPRFKIFHLKEADAGSVATTLQQTFARENVLIAVYERTNSLLIRGDEEALNIISKILAALDEQDLKDLKKGN